MNYLVKTLEQYKTQSKTDLKNARELVSELFSQPILPVEKNKFNQILGQFLESEFSSKLSQKYPVISNEIFSLTQKRKVKEKEYEFPSIISIPLGKSASGVYKKTIPPLNGGRYDNNLEISCPIPEISPEAKKQIVESKSYCSQSMADAFADPLVSKILMMESLGQLGENNIQKPTDSSYDLVWAPTVWEEKEIERDPAIFMKYAGKNFLIAQWEIPEERSLEYILRNFQD